jgi:hypothetical protein
MQTALPVKWKIFRIANYLHIAGVATMGLYILYAFTSSFGTVSTEDLVFLVLFICGIGILLANSIISLHLLERCYPDKQYSNELNVASIFIIIIAFLLILLLLIAFYFGFQATFLENRSPDLLGLILLTIIGTTIITGFYSCWLQLVLKKTLKKNYKLSVENFLNTDE